MRVAVVMVVVVVVVFAEGWIGFRREEAGVKGGLWAERVRRGSACEVSCESHACSPVLDVLFAHLHHLCLRTNEKDTQTLMASIESCWADLFPSH